jgi:hypothetical protein
MNALFSACCINFIMFHLSSLMKLGSVDLSNDISVIPAC